MRLPLLDPQLLFATCGFHVTLLTTAQHPQSLPFSSCLITALQPPLLPRHAISMGREGQSPEAHTFCDCLR